MNTKKICGQKRCFWLTTDEIRVHSDDGDIRGIGKYVVYFNLNPPALFYGELLRDEAGVVRIFDTESAAEAAALAFVNARP